MSSTSPRPTRKPLIVCFDGSLEAANALEYAARLLPGATAIVVTLWKPAFDEALSPAARPPVSDPADAEDAPRRAARQIADEGARLASKAGLEARPLAVEAGGSLWEAIETLAADRDALLVVCGTDRSGVRSALPGNLAHTLVTHISRPVLVVPSAKAAAERRRDAHERHRAVRSVAV